MQSTRDGVDFTAEDQRPIRACLTCKAAKRRCDKEVPSCARCTRLKLRCTYWTAPDLGAPYFVNPLAIQRVDAQASYPVPTQKHMPMLLHSFIETFGMAPLPVEDGSLASLLRTDWVSRAIVDPCFFHATLFSASAHLDAFQGKAQNEMTLYHYSMALKLLREKLASPGGTLDEGTIACIPPLVFFSSMKNDEDSSRIHREGLMQLLRAKGGLNKMGLGGFFSALIPVCVLTEAIIFDTELDIPGLEIPPTPLSPPLCLITATLKRAAHQTGYYNLSHEAIMMWEEIRLICRYADEQHLGTSTEEHLFDLTKTQYRSRLDTKINEDDEPREKVPPSGSVSGINESCHAAALIFWYLFDDHFSVEDETLQKLVNNLKDALSRTTMDAWIRCSPEAHTWICLVGAVASPPCSEDRVLFSLRHGQPVVCIRSEGASLYVDCWKTYDWLNRRRKLRSSGIARES